MDSDGCFNITKCRTTLVPRLIFVNTNHEICNWLKDTFGGDVTRTSVKDKPKWKPRYTWRLSHKRALELTLNLIPYLKIKKNQGIIFYKWYNIQQNYPINKRRDKYLQLKNKLSLYNKKGID